MVLGKLFKGAQIQAFSQSISTSSFFLSSSLRTTGRRIPSLIETTTIPKRYCSHARHTLGSMSNVNDRLLLPQNVTPLNYNVTLQPDLEKFTYTGSVGIELQVNKTSKSVSVNTLDLELGNVELSSGEKPTATKYDKDLEAHTFEFEKGITEGDKVTLNIDFTGELNDKLCGFYRSVHTDENGNKQVVATTQMEPTDCRRAFPCFDEPSLKATFDISLISSKEMTALSNSSVKEEKELDNGLKKTVFNTTPKMSTYLVAFIVGKLNYVESKSFRVPVRVYTTPGLEERAKFSVELAAKTLAFFEKAFDIPYPLPKMDMIAIHDFSAGAMENWGLVTYRVNDILLDEAKDDASTQQRVTEVVQHELAHQWFGNLVTMEWWDGLWLNEGFATWMSWYAAEAFYPERRVWETYVTDTLQNSLRLDGLRSSHPIQVPIERADQVNQIFDAISYCKGSSVIKMISTWLGEDVFIKGISNYLKRHAYGNTTTDDLWQALSEVSGKDISGVMGPWTKKVGFPVVSISESNDSGKNVVKATQNRYLSTGDVKPEDDQTLYPVNLSVRTKSGVEEKMFTERETEFETDLEFYKLNAQQTGIYRVLYPIERVEKLSKAGAEGLLTPEDRIGLVSDIAQLGSSGYQKTSAFLELISNWKGETESNVWNEMLSQLATIRTVWKGQPEKVQTAFKKFQEDLVVDKCKEVGYEQFSESDGLLQQQLKGMLYGAAIGSENKEFVDHALNLFAKYEKEGANAFNSNLRSSVFAAAAKFGDDSVYDKMIKIYNDPASSIAGTQAIRALGRSKSQQVREKTLAAALDGTIRSQDIFFTMSGFNGDQEGSEMLWKWLQDNFDSIYEKFPPSTGMLGSIIEIGAGGLTTKEHLAQAEAFFKDKDTKGYDKAIGIIKDRIQTRISWLERGVEDVNEWLTKKGYM